ncbi:cytochrome P450 [Dulcicalothrix desertica PCC 7102]|uniref:Cytochrome P450 n=1 Tax=Dulcicalothrix desertica PCC 7102 TaxID=232991 RepID=A0A3S1ANH6_9CYAN|nr:cytochrome P450 [Dulcicalothrix desertica]RUT05152.1 cytochrome P450 [Dulcicalothrix desertica PCC 7102]TWH43341.1 cytochrome P450 [Dulcicalothrix desertica PCC 7102]
MFDTNLPNGPSMPTLLRQMKLVFQPLQYLEDFAKVYGDNFTVRNKNGNHTVYFSHPKALEQIFTADASKLDVGSENEILRYLFGSHSVVVLDGIPHRNQRKLLAPPFHGDRMRAYGATIQDITQQVIERWQDTKPFNVRNAMQEITLRIILRVVFGLDEGTHLEKLRNCLISLLELVCHPVVSGALLFQFWKKDLGVWSPWGRIMHLLKKVDELIYSHIQETRKNFDENRKDILSLMMTARYDDGQAMTDEELRDELVSLLVIGHETSASSLVWALSWIDQLPKVQEKLQKELSQNIFEPSQLAKLPYLTAVCQETLRIYPVFTICFSRVVKSPLNVMGYELPAKTLIIPNIYLTHHRKEVFPNPKQFIPERFLERQFSPYEYLPFGGGNRQCIGMAFAMYEMKIILGTILSQYQISSSTRRPIKPARRGLTIVVPPKMQMQATPR